jgi:hypothetical protein
MPNLFALVSAWHCFMHNFSNVPNLQSSKAGSHLHCGPNLSCTRVYVSAPAHQHLTFGSCRITHQRLSVG